MISAALDAHQRVTLPDAIALTGANRLSVALWHHLPSGGAKRALFDHVRGLAQRGHALEAWCPPTADRQFLSLTDLVNEQVLPLDPAPMPRVVKWWCQHLGADVAPLVKINAMSAHSARFAEALHGRHFDVLLASSCRWLCAPMVARYVQIPTVLYLQEPYRALYEARPTLPWIAEEAVPGSSWNPRALRQWLGSAARLQPLRVQAREEQRNVRAFDRVLVNSRYSRESVLRTYGVDARVCYLGVDTTRFVNNTGERRRVLVSVGEFGVHKNPEFVIRAVGMSKTKPVLQWIANRSHADCVESMTRLSSELGVTLQLKVNVPDSELVQCYQEGLVMVYAPRLEPFGLAPLEANACGMPVIGLAEGGVRETIVDNENGRLIDDVSQMAAAIDQLFSEPGRARALGQNGAAIVGERWTLEAAAERLEQQLRQVVEERSRIS